MNTIPLVISQNEAMLRTWLYGITVAQHQACA